jgi:hypothetical protein
MKCGTQKLKYVNTCLNYICIMTTYCKYSEIVFYISVLYINMYTAILGNSDFHLQFLFYIVYSLHLNSRQEWTLG